MPLDLASSAKGNVFGWTHIEKFGKQHNPRREALIIPGHNLMEIRSIEANEPLRIAFDSRGERIFTASHEGAVEIWNIAMGKREQVLGQVPQLPSGIALNTDNSLVAVHVSGRSKDGKGSMTLLRVNGSDAPVVLPTYGKVRQFAFAPTTNTLYFSTDAGSCKHGGTGVFALETGQTDPKEVSLAPVSNVIDFAMHPSGNLIASAGQSRLEPCTGQSVVSVWDVKTNQNLHTFLPYQPGAVSYLSNAQSVAFSLDGKLLAMGDSSGYLQVWDWEREQNLLTYELGGGSILRVTWGVDNMLIVYDSAGYIRVFHLP